jgi:SAM-dependent methyltransferase
MPKDPTSARYLNGDYASKNPDWDSSDAEWKANQLIKLLSDQNLKPKKIVEIGCGSGEVLISLQKQFPDSSFAGYDIAPDLQTFWELHKNRGIHFELADYNTLNLAKPDLILLFDVLEHLGNPWQFLSDLHSRCNLVAIHFPLDLSAMSVIREKPLLNVRHKVGHLHYFTKNLALALLEESGFEVIDARFTHASANTPKRSLKTKIFGQLRQLLYKVNNDLGARILGGETLMVLAQPRKL